MTYTLRYHCLTHHCHREWTVEHVKARRAECCPKCSGGPFEPFQVFHEEDGLEKV